MNKNLPTSKLIEKFCLENSISITEQQINLLLTYIGLLIKWNKVYNLTSITDIKLILTKHVFDCLLLTKLIKKCIYKKQQNINLVNLLDVGTGAGLPAIVVAIMLPEVQVDCVDIVLKKISFIKQIQIQLKLINLNPQHINVAKLSKKYDFITARAFSSLKDFLALTVNSSNNNTTWLAMKGKIPQEELNLANKQYNELMFHVEQLPALDYALDRCVIVINYKKIENG